MSKGRYNLYLFESSQAFAPMGVSLHLLPIFLLGEDGKDELLLLYDCDIPANGVVSDIPITIGCS